LAQLPQFEFDRDDAEQLLSEDELGSSALNVTPAGLTFKPGFAIAGADVTFSAASSLQVQAFNSLDDRDVDGALLPKAPDKSAPPRLVTLTTDGAWMKYRLDANLKASAKASLGDAGFSVDATAGAMLADYRTHKRDESVRDAFVEDVTAGVRSAFDLSAVERLQPGDMVTLQTRGAIEAKVTLSVSDLFTAQASALWSLAGVQKTVGFTVSAGATASFNVRVSDEFVVSFAGVDAKTWRIGVRKGKTRQIGVGVAATFEVAAAKPKDLQAFLDGVKDALIGQPLERVKAILKKGTLEDLTDTERGIVIGLLERFGLSNVLDALKALNDRIDAIDEGIDGAIADIAKAKITVGFAYEYARIVEDAQLLQMTVDRAHLRRFHPDVIRGQLAGAIDSLAKAEAGVTLENYLNQQTMTRTQSWGFTLGIGKWVSLAGKDTDKLTVVARRNLEGHIQESYLGTRSYQAKWQGDTLQWFGDFRADMRAYSRTASPSLPEFDLGIHLALTASVGKLSAGDIDEYIDFAACWGIVAADEIDGRREQLMDAKGTAQDVAIQLTIGDEALRLLLPSVAAAADADFAEPLAIGMPRQSKTPGLRTPSERFRTYTRVWEFYLTHPDAGADELRANASAILKAEGQPALADVERDAPKPHPLLDFTMSGRVLSDGDPLERWRSFRNGAALLQQALTSGAPAETPLDRARRSMERCWTQVHHLRAIGGLLVGRAKSVGVLPKIGRTFTVSPQKTGGAAKAFVVVA
jgi:hypothetical protein